MFEFFKPFRPLTLASLTLAASILVAGCSLMPRYERPAAPIAAQWPASAQSGQVGLQTSPHPGLPPAGEGGIPGWQSYFTDTTLRELISTALANNRDLRVATLNIEQARAQLGIRRADPFPTLNAAVTGARTPTSAGGINSAYAAGFTVTAYELDFFGRVASLKEQALAQYLATAEAAQAAQLSLSATVAQGWLALLADEELLAASRQTLATREGSLRLVELKARHGAASDLELRLAQTLRESARVTLAQQQRQRALDENALVLVLGQALPAPAKAVLAQGAGATNDSSVASAADQPGRASTGALGPVPPQGLLTGQHFADLPAGLPSDLLTRRPDIRAAEQALIASNANIGAARAAFFPRISLTAGVGSASSELAALFKSGSWGWTLAPQLLLPIFDAGRNQASLEVAKVGRDIAVAQYEKAIQSAFREVADALATRRTLTQQLQASTALLQAESARARLTQLRLDAGAASQLDWLDAQRSLFAAQQALVQTQLAVLQNQVALYKVLGGSARTDPVPDKK